uniref:phospholipase A2 n=1 Tax=Nelumbo nucifera TaxID=4432 RepID=A0A823A0V0_NELNU|nr:TPA_asm: hypothetical protein HUJ06_018876 [Nelumbo nucifera]
MLHRNLINRARFIVVFSCVLLVVVECSNPQVKCSKTCVADNCNSVGIRYGKFCGVGWTGCPGEKPCDDLDACCKTHDECVEKKGLMSVKCHEKFKSCIKRVQKSGKIGFSRQCPYEIAMPTMIQGMDMAILFSQFGDKHKERVMLQTQTNSIIWRMEIYLYFHST